MEENEKQSDPKPFFTMRTTRGGLLAALTVFVIVLYGLLNRTPSEFLRYGGLMAGGFFLAVLGGGTFAWLRSARVRPTRDQVGQLFALAFVLAVFGGLTYFGLFAGIVDLLRWLLARNFASAQAGALLVAAIAGAAGVALFVMRLRLRLLYGFSEVGVGLAVAAWRGYSESAAGVPSSPEFYVAILTASIYLIVRGLDNVHQALQAKGDLSLNYIRRYLNSESITLTVSRSK